MLNTLLKFRRSTALLAALPDGACPQAFAAQTVSRSARICNAPAAGPTKFLENQGFKVEVKPVPDLHSIDQAGDSRGCPSFIDGYVVIGHVPVGAIHKLLAERPKIIGISIPGMPANLPGMPGPRSKPVAIYEIAADGSTSKIFMTVP
jgi:hypothetical protein